MNLVQRVAEGTICSDVGFPGYQNKCERAKINGFESQFDSYSRLFILISRIYWLSALQLYCTSKIKKSFCLTTRLIIKKETRCPR